MAAALLSVLAFFLVAIPSASADDWRQWRGPQGNGHATDRSIATHWNQKTNVVWRAPLPGPGGATPVVAAGKIFITSSEGDDLVLVCLDSRSGKPLWKQKVSTGNSDARAGEGNSASPSPSTDGEHVWVMFSNGALACYDLDGKAIWQVDLEDRFGKFDIQFGMTSTPILDGDGLYLQLIHGSMRRNDDTRTGKVIKLDKLTGNTVWEMERVTDADFECKHSYASPCIYADDDRRFLVVHGADCTTGHDLATGKELWRFAGLNGPSEYNKNRHDPTFRFVASPSCAPGVIVIPTAKAGPTVAINVDQNLKGNISADSKQVRWVFPETPDVSIPLIHDGLVYNLHKDGRLQCIRLDNGQQVYFERTHTAQHRTSPVLADGKIYFCDREGHCTVVAAGPEFQILADNDLEEPITASPIVSDGTLYIRSYDAMYAIRESR